MNASADAPGDRLEPGAVLAAERERLNLSRADIAQRLRMSVSQVEALELGDYTRLPRGTFLRGFVRNYARVVGVDPESILQALTDEGPRHSRPGIVVASQNIRFDPMNQRFSGPYVKAAGLATTAVVIAFAVMYWWLFVRPAPPATAAARKAVVAETTKAPAPAPRLAAPVAEAPRIEAPKPPEPAARVEPPKVEPKPEPPKAEPPKAAPAPAAAPPAATPSVVQASSSVAQPLDAAAVMAAGGSVIRLKFRGSSWVEIKDGRGKLLLSRVNAAGSEAEVVGKGPFTVVVGNAPEVSMQLNDRAFDLEPHTRVAVARFTIN